jgi:hypothetical protein
MRQRVIGSATIRFLSRVKSSDGGVSLTRIRRSIRPTF